MFGMEKRGGKLKLMDAIKMYTENQNSKVEHFCFGHN